MDVSLPVYVYTQDRATGYQYGGPPRYYVYGGLVFTPLSLDFMRTLGRNPSDPANSELYYELYYRRHETPGKARPEPVVLASVLADEANANFGAHGHGLIDKINGVRIDPASRWSPFFLQRHAPSQ